MMIDIGLAPPADIFKNRRKLIALFLTLLAVVLLGLLLGAYAVFSETGFYEQLEILSVVLFVAPSPFVAFVGEKLQEYKKVTPPQLDKLLVMRLQHPEVRTYCDRVAQQGRHLIRAEYEACEAWAERAGKSDAG